MSEGFVKAKANALLQVTTTLYIFRSPEFIFSQLSTALMSFSMGDVSPRFPFLTCSCYGRKMNLALFNKQLKSLWR